ncbi:MAG: VWA domain-containing protein, partial [Acidimicrobiia bacterium]|nr:VWA domain-containing protein [Acidimicrobiia bacterium]
MWLDGAFGNGVPALRHRDDRRIGHHLLRHGRRDRQWWGGASGTGGITARRRWCRCHPQVSYQLSITTETTPVEVLSVLVDRLREAGLSVGPMTISDLADASELVGLGKAEDVYFGFRSLCVTHHDQIPIFDRIFLETFRAHVDPSLQIARPRKRTWTVDAADLGEEDIGDDQLGTVVGASEWERLGDRDFATLDSDELATVRSLIAGMRWRPADVKGRRRQPAAGGDRPDLRRSLRYAVRSDADMIPLVFDERRRRRRPLVVLADVSGSMDRYSEMLLYFLHSVGGTLGKVEAFVFATRITRVTRELYQRNAVEAISSVSETVEDWA